MNLDMIEKRNGETVPFDGEKIVIAVRSAIEDVPDIVVDEDTADCVASVVCDALAADRKNDVPNVEMVQDVVEKTLMEFGLYAVAQAYIRYRFKRELRRKANTTDDEIMALLEHCNDDANVENSNKNPTIASTQRDYMAGYVSRDLTERFLLPKIVTTAHKAGKIHFHDADYFSQHIHNCCLVNLENMLQNGTVISETQIEKPHSFSTACNIATQVIAQIASCQHGGQTITLSHLAPFVDVSRKRIAKDYPEVSEDIRDRMLRDEIKKGIQTIQYQILTLMTTNGQTPFVTVWLYLNELEEGRCKDDLALLIEESLRQRLQGVKNEKGIWVTPAFPKLVYVLEDDNMHPEGKYWYLTELAARCSAKRLVPDYISEKILLESKYPREMIPSIRERRDEWGNERIWGENKFKNLSDEDCDKLQAVIDEVFDDAGRVICPHKLPEKAAGFGVTRDDLFPKAYPVMGCRSLLTADQIHRKYYGRFNQGVVTLNLVDVALTARQRAMSESEVAAIFWRVLDERLEICHIGLKARHDRLKGTFSDVSPIHWQYGGLARLSKGETIDPLLFDNYSTISLGYAGLYECVKALTGRSHTDKKVAPFAKEIMQYMNDKCAEWREKENISYSLYGTPIESTTYKFAECLKKRFGIIPGVTDRDYITNSYHVHVTEPINAFEKLTLEAEYQKLSPGGAISYVEIPDMTDNIPAVLSLLEHIYNNILYAELNTKSDYCQCCGYDGEIQIVEDEDGKLIWRCPECGNEDQDKMNVARRTCGYIGTQFWNQGRTAEIRDRVLHL